MMWVFPGGTSGKEFTCNAREVRSISGWERSPGRGHGNPLQYSYLENPMCRGAWRATVHGFAKSLKHRAHTTLSPIFNQAKKEKGVKIYP